MTEEILNEVINKGNSDANHPNKFPTPSTALKEYTQQEEKTFRLGDQFFKVTKSLYSIMGSPQKFSATDMIKTYLLHYRFITNQQLRIVMPDISRKLLARLTHLGEIDSKLISDTRISYFFLTEKAFAKIRSAYPALYLDTARIPDNRGSLPKRDFHDIHMRDCIYTILSINSFMAPDWYTSVALLNEKSPYESIEVAIKDTDWKASAPTGTMIADAAILFRDNGSILVEEDCNTEDKSFLKEKCEGYANYFSSIRNNCSDIRLLFNVTIKNNKPVKSETEETGKKEGQQTVHNIRLLMEGGQLETLNDAYKRICEMCSKPGSLARTYSSMKALMDGYISKKLSLYEGIEALESYVSKSKASSKPNIPPRCRELATIIKESFDEEPDWAWLINSGISVTVTDSERFERYAYFLCPYESGFMDFICATIEEEYPAYKAEKARASSKANGAVNILRNCINITNRLNQSSTVIKRYFVAEISADIAERERIQRLFEEYDNSFGNEVHILLLVASQDDARAFAKETDCITNFCNKDLVTEPNGEFGLTIRFLDYSNCGREELNLFVPDNNGRIATTEDL